MMLGEFDHFIACTFLCAACLSAASKPPIARMELIGTDRVDEFAIIEGKGTITKTIVQFDVPESTWTKVGISFIPLETGSVTLMIGGPWLGDRPLLSDQRLYVCWDDLEVTGSVIRNAGFEAMNDDFLPYYWYRVGGKDAGAVNDVTYVRNGEWSACVWMGSRLAQKIPVTAGKQVIVTGWALAPAFPGER